MRSIELCCVPLLLGLAGIGTAEAKKGSLSRTAQVIVMGSAASATAAGAGTGETGAVDGVRPVISPPIPTNFRAHDLSRQWVEFDMDTRFASSSAAASTAYAQNADPIELARLAELGPVQRAATLPPAALIAIPRWMQGGLSTPAATNLVTGCAAGDYRQSGFLRPDAEARRFSYYSMMSNIACEYGIPVGLFDAMIIRESRYRADAFSEKKAFGLTQLIPETAASLGVDRYDIQQNLRGGARYLRQQLDRFGQVHLALAAYNAGPGRVRNGMVPRIAETQAYVENVLLNWRRLSGFAPVASVQRVVGPAARPLQTGRIATVSSY